MTLSIHRSWLFPSSHGHQDWTLSAPSRRSVRLQSFARVKEKTAHERWIHCPTTEIRVQNRTFNSRFCTWSRLLTVGQWIQLQALENSLADRNGNGITFGPRYKIFWMVFCMLDEVYFRFPFYPLSHFNARGAQNNSMINYFGPTTSTFFIGPAAYTRSQEGQSVCL
jgi:hypothetical protein